MEMRKKVPVNELLLQDMIAVSNSKTPEKQEELKGENISVKDEEHGVTEVKENPKIVRRKRENIGYEELYLVYKSVSKVNRQLIYIDGELYERFARFIKMVAAERKVSMTSFINNVIQQHWEEHKDTIQELYDRSRNKPL